MAAPAVFATVQSAPGSRASVQLAPAIAEGGRNPKARGVFHRAVASVTIDAGAVVLASLPDGSGSLRTDDVATLTVERPDGSTRAWRHDFRDRRGDIRAIPPEDVTALFARGSHTITLELRDAMPPVFSSTSFYLIYPAGPTVASSGETATPPTTPKPMPEPDIIASLMSLPSPSPSPSPTPTPTPAAISQTAATQKVAARVLAVATAEQQHSAGSFDYAQDNPGDQVGARWSPLSLLIAAVVVIGMAVSAMLQVRRWRAAVPRDALSGLVNVYDVLTGERLDNVDLTQFRERAVIATDPLRVLRAMPQPQRNVHAPANALATLRTTGDGVGVVCVVEGSATDRHLLSNLTEVDLNGRVTLEYRNPAHAWPQGEGR